MKLKLAIAAYVCMSGAALAQTYGQVQWGLQLGTTTPNLVIYDGTTNVPVFALNKTTHTISYSSLSLSGNLTVGGNLTVTGSASVGTTLSVASSATIGAGLIVNGSVEMNGTPSISTSVIRMGTSLYPTNTPGRIETTGNLTSGSAIVTGIPSTAGVQAGWEVTGPYINTCGAPLNTVVSVDSSTQVTVRCAATSTVSGATLRFGRDFYSTSSQVMVNSGGFKNIVLGDASLGHTGFLWYDQYYSGLDGNAPIYSPIVAVGVDHGRNVGTYGIRSSSSDLSTTINQRLFNLLDGPGKNGTRANSWGIYGEIRAESASNVGTGTALAAAIEYEIANFWPELALDPYTAFGDGPVTGIYFAGCGANETGANNCGAAFRVISQPKKFLDGISYQNDSLADRGSGRGYAVHMAQNQSLRWSTTGNADAGEIWSSGTNLIFHASAGNLVRSQVGTTNVLDVSETDIRPAADATFDIGTTSLRWKKAWLTNGLAITSTTVSGLPLCNSGNNGTIAYVSDLTAPTYGGTAVGGGGVRGTVLCNGTTWVTE